MLYGQLVFTKKVYEILVYAPLVYACRAQVD